MNIDDMRGLLSACRKDTKKFGRTFFPERVHLKDSSLHDTMYDLLDHCDAPYIAISAPRGIGKSTIFSLFYPAKEIAYRDCNFIVQASKTARQAVRDSNDLRNELLTNPRLKAIFGSFKPAGKDTPFSQEVWATTPLLNSEGQIVHPGTMVLPTSWTQEVRGVKYTRFRPDRLIVDDLEGTEGVMSEDQRKKLLDWFSTDLLNLVQRAKKKAKGEFPWRVIVVGTLLHQDSLLANLMDKKAFPGWERVELSICNEKFESNWPDFQTTTDLRKIADDYKAIGRMDKFSMEYMGKVIYTKDAPFQEKFFKDYDEADIRDKFIENVVIVDPAKTKEFYSADSAIVCWGFDGTALYLRDLIVDKFENPEALYDTLFSMCLRWNVKVLGIEKTGLETFITHPIRTLMLREGYSFELVELKATGDKLDRIRSLAPFYRKGLIYHNPQIAKPLELQLMSFPKSKRFDAADAAAYIVELLEAGDRYFTFGTAREAVISQVDFEAKLKEAQRVCPKPLRAALYC